MNTTPPLIETHSFAQPHRSVQFDVARDDILPGGTKSRYIGALFAEAHEVVYASPRQGAAQIALALTAQQLGKRCTIFTPSSMELHANTVKAIDAGADVRGVDPGFWTHVRAKAAMYVRDTPGATLAPFGLRIPEAATTLKLACQEIKENYDHVWCAAGSGTLAAALSLAFPRARIFAVCVGHDVKKGEAGRARLIRYDRSFARPARVVPPFPCSATFDAKAWEWMIDWYEYRAEVPRVLFWNVYG